MKKGGSVSGPAFFIAGLVLTMSLSGCDYWPPALLAQLEQLRNTVQDLSDERAQLEARLREATLLRDELRGRLEEMTRENEGLKQRIARLEQDRAKGRKSAARSAQPRTLRTASASGRGDGDRVLSLTRPPMRGKDVKAIQDALKTLGLPVRVDGYYGSDTKAAVAWLQRQHGLRADGVVGSQTRSMIQRQLAERNRARLIRLVSPYMQGRDVSRIQRALRHAGLKVRVDGTFGKNTHRAVKRFQRREGLRADGVVGPRTREALGLS